MRYLAGSVHRKLCFATEGSTVLTGFVDADWAGDHADRKSTSGHQCRQPKLNILPLGKPAENYNGLGSFSLMSLPHDGPTNVYEDNQSCIKVAQLDRCSQRTKHIDVRHHQLRDLQESGVVALIYRSSSAMPADILTKPLAKGKFNHHLALLGMR
uniref:Reverse transcriptase Ty1/copia-type domain-containing protein n=1 Tax=Trichuris muris TaxID=70415 RepID=A0A5S6QZ60_TRIMR